MDHHLAMRRAIEIGLSARVTAPPNPWVGCVIVKDNAIIGEGYSQPAGQAHAEIMALHQAGAHAEGATAYVSLEPCSHFGKTPPCVHALIEKKIAKVFVALEDPDHRVSGNGIKQLREAGVEVEVGLEKEMATKAFEPYLFQRSQRKSYCVAKAAITIDGRIGATDGSSKWITTDLARMDVHCLRAESQAILIGSGTVEMDNPSLTVRNSEMNPTHPPLRIVLDRSGKTKVRGPLFYTKLAPLLMVTSSTCSEQKKTEWEHAGAEVLVVDNLDQLFKKLAERGIIQVLVEGGSDIYTSLLLENLINRLVVYIGPKIIGNTGIPIFGNLGVENIDLAHKLQLLENKTLGDCIRLDYSFC